MQADSQKEHEWLRQLVGDWTIEAASPDDPDELLAGTETIRALGDLWIVAEGEGEMPGGGYARTMMTLGFDPQKDRFVGSWVGSMMTHMWMYEGRLDPAGRVLTLECEGPDFQNPEKMRPYRDIIELRSDDERGFSSVVRGENGQWQQIMSATYRRKK